LPVAFSFEPLHFWDAVGAASDAPAATNTAQMPSETAVKRNAGRAELIMVSSLQGRAATGRS
jgi:hypothetical protein